MSTLSGEATAIEYPAIQINDYRTPAPHFAMCWSGHSEADKVEFYDRNVFRCFLKIGMYVLGVSFGLVLYCCLLRSSRSLPGIISSIFSPPGPRRKQSCKKPFRKEKYIVLDPLLFFVRNFVDWFLLFWCCSGRAYFFKIFLVLWVSGLPGSVTCVTFLVKKMFLADFPSFDKKSERKT